MAKCKICIHKYICEIRTCAECVGGCCDECELYNCDNGKPDIEKCEYFINEENVVSVVRCKDCKYYSDSAGLCNVYLQISTSVKPYDYCSYGRRKDNNAE